MRITLLIVLTIVAFASQAQTTGTVSYVTDENVYVRFTTTDGMSAGDTLFRPNGDPCVIVSNLSSISAVTTPVNNCDPEVGTSLTFSSNRKPELDEEEVSVPADTVVDEVPLDTVTPVEQINGTRGRGRASTAAYNVYSPNSNRVGYTRSVTRVGLDVDRIANRDLSISFYGNYQVFRRYDDLETSYPSAGRAQVYNANISYRPTPEWSLTAGRFINRRTSSLGSIDGLQGERQLGDFYVGAIAGFRPDYVTFGTRFDQFQYGVYSGWDKISNELRTSTTVGLLEQTASGATDRRYLYLQHSTTWKDLSLFASSEADLFENFDTASARSTFRLTHLYLSLNYRISRSWSVFGSYDTRQQILFFETFDNEVERILSEQGMQNGVRLRVNYRKSGGFMWSGGYHRRFGREGREISNINILLGYSDLPWIGGRFSIRGHLNLTNDLGSEVASARYANSFLQQRVQWSIYGRYLHYQYPAYKELSIPAYWYMGTDWSVRFGDGWQLGVLAEYSLRDQQDVIRCNLQLIKRFGWSE